jgi:hypothetical protein
MLPMPMHLILFVPRDSDMESGHDSRPVIDSSWWSDARCNDGSGTLGPGLLNLEVGDIVAAKRICAGCPATARVPASR